MIYSHIFVDGNLYSKRRLEHCHAKGDTVRLTLGNKEIYLQCTEVIWCLDEDSVMGQRVNLRLEKEKKS